jgi:hypothetical protein
VRVNYRIRQFREALNASPAPEELARARQALSPPLMELFLSLQAQEQAHSLKVFRLLRELDQLHPDLLAAALLHDVGKSRYRLHLWERVLIVLSNALFPHKVKSWGQSEPRGWRRPFVIAEQHPNWGSEMAIQAGASSLTASLIRRHQEILEPSNGEQIIMNPPDPKQVTLEDVLLKRLQQLDGES